MARKKDTSLSPRQRQSKQIMQQKAAQIKRQHFVQKFRLIAFVTCGALALIFCLWVWKTKAVSRLQSYVSDGVYGATVKAGYSLQTLYLEGRNRTPIKDIDAALDIDKGTPILQLSLDEIRSRLEKIESIKYAAVERALPNTLYVRVVEREPVAMWQYQGKIALVDDNGTVMNGLDITPYRNLPLVVGENAPNHIGSLQELLNAQPELSKKFSSAIWVGDRRWNIRLHRKKNDETNLETTENNAENTAKDIEIMLPEKEPLVAWKKLAEMQKKQQILDRDINAIDLRIAGRSFIKLPKDKIDVK